MGVWVFTGLGFFVGLGRFVAVVVVVVEGAAVVVLVDEVLDVLLAARGVCDAPAHALSTRQAAANQTVCRMVTEGNPGAGSHRMRR
ncbi:hypothetical protein [Pedococcus dokdonensis]|uniref:hypothetical protein n=1 Tax=Pedococcus dokdonensis TaxID=443156 RepID=UPI0012FE1E3F|nr:hypothetical protein [Pedococcus dokdonensis]